MTRAEMEAFLDNSHEWRQRRVQYAADRDRDLERKLARLRGFFAEPTELQIQTVRDSVEKNYSMIIRILSGRAAYEMGLVRANN
jgi:hypothetical protein